MEANLPEERVKPEGRYLESDEPEPTRETRELFHVPVGAPLGHRDDVENGNGNGNGNHYGYDNGNGNGNGNHQIPPPAQPVEISQPTPRREVATADVSTEDVLGAPVQNKGMLNRPSIFGVTIPGLQVDPDQNEVQNAPDAEPQCFATHALPRVRFVACSLRTNGQTSPSHWHIGRVPRLNRRTSICLPNHMRHRRHCRQGTLSFRQVHPT